MIPVPFADAGGPVNVYAIEERDGGFALFDTGVGTEEGEATLRAGLAAVGLRIADLRRILVSHGHVDHYGMAEVLAQESGAPVYVHPADRDKVAAPNPWPVRGTLVIASDSTSRMRISSSRKRLPSGLPGYSNCFCQFSSR